MGTASSHEYIIKSCHFHTKQKMLLGAALPDFCVCLCLCVSVWVCASVQGKLLHTQLCICKVTIVF